MKPLKIGRGRKLKYTQYLGWFALLFGIAVLGAAIWEVWQSGSWGDGHLFLQSIFFIILGVMHINGYYSDPVCGLNIDDTGIEQDRLRGEEQRIRWGNIQSLKLDLHEIRYQYKDSDQRDTLELPNYSYKQFQQIKAKLDEAAERFGLKYEVA